MERKEAEKRRRLGRYELLERLGEGGMGEVWKAHDTQLQRLVAIKLLRTDISDDPDFVASFLREARLVAALRHPNIVQIHDFQLADPSTQGKAYMVMDYIEGGTLATAFRATVRQGIFWPASDIVELFTSISLALDYAHAQGMVHRDIKPANILLQKPLAGNRSPGEPVLTDFGIARWQGSGNTVTGFVGTPLYISPEQAQSRPVDARSDLYSLGVILYEILTGKAPFHGENPLAIMLQHVHEPPPAPALINPRVSPALSAVVLRSIAKDPQERFPSAAQMTIALAQAFNLPVPARLDRAEARREPQAFNPLQPRPGATPLPPTIAPALTSTPAVGSHESTRITPGAHFPGVPQVRSADAAQRTTPPLPVDASRRSRPALPRWLAVVSVACVVLLLLGIGAAVLVPRLSSSSGTPTPTAGGGVIGHVLFLHSSAAPAGVFNQLQIDLTGIQAPPSGQLYYAWLTQANSEAARIPHWQLQVQNSAVHALYTANPPQTDLLTGSDGFLITTEDAGSPPVIPIPAPARHLYYALIPHPLPASLSFEVKPCPANGASSVPAPCL
jgi:serine/threonine protein kinase